MQLEITDVEALHVPSSQLEISHRIFHTLDSQACGDCKSVSMQVETQGCLPVGFDNTVYRCIQYKHESWNTLEYSYIMFAVPIQSCVSFWDHRGMDIRFPSKWINEEHRFEDSYCFALGISSPTTWRIKHCRFWQMLVCDCQGFICCQNGVKSAQHSCIYIYIYTLCLWTPTLANHSPKLDALWSLFSEFVSFSHSRFEDLSCCTELTVRSRLCLALSCQSSPKLLVTYTWALFSSISLAV